MEMIEEFVKISKYAGMREDLIQAGGGNTSVKLSDGTMFIKSSGIQLSEVSEMEGYSRINVGMIVDYLDALIAGEEVCTEKEILNRALLDGGRPSIETFLHATTDTVTLHTHPVSANILLSRTGGMDELKTIFPQALFIDYATPGLELAKTFYSTYRQAIKNRKTDFSIIFLKNHGIIISSASAKNVIELNEEVIYKIEEYLGINATSYHAATEIYHLLCQANSKDEDIIYKVENKTVLDYYAENNYKIWPYQFSPDCVVFCGRKPLNLLSNATPQDFIDFKEKFGELRLIQFNNMLYIKSKNVKKAKEIESVLAFSAQVDQCNKGKHTELLSSQEQNRLINWDAEKYRRQMK